MKYCKNCGAGMSDEASFCPNCGESAAESTQVVGNEIVSYESSNVKARGIVGAIILTIITCGLYSIYWMIKMNDEMLELAREKGQSGVVVFLFSLLTCGIYSYFWYYKMGTCVDKIKGSSNGMNGVVYIILALFGLSIVNMVLIQSAINDKVDVK